MRYLSLLMALLSFNSIATSHFMEIQKTDGEGLKYAYVIYFQNNNESKYFFLTKEPEKEGAIPKQPNMRATEIQLQSLSDKEIIFLLDAEYNSWGITHISEDFNLLQTSIIAGTPVSTSVGGSYVSQPQSTLRRCSIK